MSDPSWATSPATRKSMQANRSRDTGPELALRRALHALGLRYRVCTRPLPEVRHAADVVFRPAQVVVEVRGCFWHGCPEHYRVPSANANYWSEKVQRNMNRDQENDQRLRTAGWLVEVVWEHEDPAEASKRIADVVRRRSCRPVTPGVRGSTSRGADQSGAASRVSGQASPGTVSR